MEDALDHQTIDRLVARARDGDEDAFGEVVKALHGRVYAVIYRVVRNAGDADELAQVSWVKAWQRLGSYKQDARFFTWLYRIAVNTALDALRKKARRREVLLPEEHEREEVSPLPVDVRSRPERPDRSVIRHEVMTRFQAALETLSHEHRTVLMLREVEGLSYEEIAEVMNARVGTVMSRIHYARKSLRTLLGDLV